MVICEMPESIWQPATKLDSLIGICGKGCVTKRFYLFNHKNASTWGSLFPKNPYDRPLLGRME